MTRWRPPPPLTEIDYIYGIFNHVTNQVLYVGRTGSPKQRFKCTYEFLRGIRQNVTFEVLEIAPISASTSAEYFWINYFLSLGCKLENKSTKGKWSRDVHAKHKKAYYAAKRESTKTRRQGGSMNYPRTEYEMTESDLATLMEAFKPVPMIMLQCGNPPSVQDNANRAWEALGKKMGFDYMTVRPGNGNRFFSAVPSETEAQRDHRLQAEAEEQRVTEIKRLEKAINQQQVELYKKRDNITVQLRKAIKGGV